MQRDKVVVGFVIDDVHVDVEPGAAPELVQGEQEERTEEPA